LYKRTCASEEYVNEVIDSLTDDIYVTLSKEYVAGTGFVGACDTDYQVMYDAIKNNKRVICEDSIGRIAKKSADVETICFYIYMSNGCHIYEIYNDNSVVYTLTALFEARKIAQETGQATAFTMSQKAITDALELKADKTDVVAAPTTAEVGQTVAVSEIDENGKPIAWEAVDMNSVVTFNTSDYNINMLNAMVNSMQGETFTMVDCSVLVHDVSVAVAEKKVPLIFDSNIGAKCFITGVAEDYQIIGSVVGNYSGEFLKADVVIMNEGVHLFVTEIGAEDSTSGGFVVSDTAPTDTSILWVDTSDDSNDGLQEAVNMALAQAKASGEFDGKDGKIPVKGTDYFTSADKAEMVDSVKAALPTLTITGIDSDGVSHTWTMYGVAQ
jgi:hypothetical protein